MTPLRHPSAPGAAGGSPVAAALKACWTSFLGVGAISGVVNILTLTGSLFMLQVYDRVLGSQSVPTLLALSVIAAIAFAFQGGLDILRGRVMALAADHVDETVGPATHAAVAALPLRAPRGAQETLQPFRDLDSIRAFLCGPAPLAFFDLPWTPIYLVVLYLLHPWLAWMTIVAGLVLIALAIATDRLAAAPTRAAAEAGSRRNLAADQSQRNAEALRAMGFFAALDARWRRAHAAYIAAQRQANARAGLLSGLAKTLRVVVQSATLGLGAYLAIQNEMTAGGIIAGTILSGRAMAPIDHAIAGWRSFLAARMANERLRQMLATPRRGADFQLPRPSRSLAVEQLALGPPGAGAPSVRRANFTLQAGQALGLIGPSASGKTSLVRGLVGAWAPMAGKITLDGASIDQWSPEALGPAIGYLPQDVQLFDGTIAENIARFADPVDSEAVMAAAKAAGFHEQIVAMPAGYDTQVGQGGAHLSAGQRQRLGLARALYGDPFLVVLDEPNSNLDAEGEACVVAAIAAVRKRGGVAIIVAHRRAALESCDLAAVMRNGEMVAFGPRDEVLSKLAEPPRRNVVRHPALQGPVSGQMGAKSFGSPPAPRSDGGER
ncbi:MAG: type I secretion system permease/ATPase [Methylobacteriaceae bacterium]|nr:type I secretion system permease/ATPase [Methylobacteriaceae bacterium]